MFDAVLGFVPIAIAVAVVVVVAMVVGGRVVYRSATSPPLQGRASSDRRRARR